MKSDEIVNKIEKGKFSKKDLSAIMHACATAFDEGNYDKG